MPRRAQRRARRSANLTSGGRPEGVVDNPPTVLPHIKAGKLRPLALSAIYPSPGALAWMASA